MAFHSLMIRLVAELRCELPGQATVVELGNQTFKPRTGDLLGAGEVLTRTGLPFDSQALQELDRRHGEPLAGATAEFYRALGFVSYQAIDINRRFGSLVMDLNRDLAEAYGYRERFDLVTNNGTGEHVFDQRAVFSNMHALTKEGGILLHVLPFFNWINHGFFNFSPLLFADLAAANRYEILRLSLANNRGWEKRLAMEEMQERCAVTRDTAPTALQRFLGRKAKKRVNRALSLALDQALRGTPHVSIVAALRKTNEAPFRLPIQGMYDGANIEDPELRASYRKAGA